ncbi:hypothetical protein F5890DRAFT_1419243 [Lentinula detonsa]|uniref:DNA endonuclease activator Ctp1 C-terminal domain-containing protein n=2 Tax=Lentinula detonsa TaxID=2804962 RepID=A0AA38PSW2_9AGAR|nr:hypothetical protein F5890DRAFT_1419243 [Lentinula detonsa]
MTLEDETTNAFSSAAFRERDKAIQRRHEDDIRRHKIALDKMNQANADLRTSLFDLKNRSNRLVQSLGFDDLMEAQVYIDARKSEDGQTTYRDCLKLAGSLEDELKEAKTLIAKMENREKELEGECSVLRKAKDESTSAYRQLVKERQNLQERHNDTIKANNAAQERRQKDYEKWKGFKRWILCAADIEHFKHHEKEIGLDKVNRADGAKELFRIVKRKHYQLSQLDNLEDQMRRSFVLVYFPFPPHAIITAPVNNCSRTPTQSSSPVNPSLSRAKTPDPAVSGSIAYPRPTTNPSPSATNNLHSHIPLSPQLHQQRRISSPVPFSPTLVSSSRNDNIGKSKQTKMSFRYAQRYPSSPTPMPRTRQPVLPRHEKDVRLQQHGQGFDELPPKKFLKSNEWRRIPSDKITGDDSRSRRQSAPSTLRVTEDPATPKPLAMPMSQSMSPYSRKESRNWSDTRGRDKQNDNDNYKENENVSNIPNSARHSQKRKRKLGDNQMTLQSYKGKGKDKELDAAARSTPKGSLDDYLIYKGRGRYGKDKNRGEEDATINELYEIDSEQNAGLRYQFEEVVRGREKRRQLIGGDCDDCRDYYTAVGPKPPRLQPPLWKSPVKRSHDAGPSSKPCPHHRNNGKRGRSLRETGNQRKAPSTSASEISAHKQNISRHRAVWAPGNEPPGYWEIGFPNTQRAEEINKDAREMQRRQREMVEQEALKKGGRYRRK